MAEGESPGKRKLIPSAKFIEDVGAHIAGSTVEEKIQELNQYYQQYGMVETQMMQNKARLMGKLPEIQKTLDALNMLRQRQEDNQEVLFNFELGNQVYAKAKVNPETKANLWLGADVMLEYPLDEAIALLEDNISNCTANLETLNKDLELIKDYKTTTEVNIARVYNFNITTKRRTDEPVSA